MLRSTPVGAEECALMSTRPPDERIPCLGMHACTQQEHASQACNPKMQLGAPAEEQIYGHRGARIEERTPFRQVHLMSRSVCTFSESTHLSGAHNPEAHLGACAEEHMFGHPGAHIRGTHIDRCMPQSATRARLGLNVHA